MIAASVQLPAEARGASPSGLLVRRVNQLYHELTQGTFDREHYWRHRAERRLWNSVARILRRSAAGSPRCVADVGCGTGFVTAILGAALTPADRVLAVDVTEAALGSTMAKWRTAGLTARGPHISCLSSDVQSLPVASGSVDLLAMNAALHHLPCPEAALAEIHRVLRPGGLFALGFEPNRGHFASIVIRNLARGIDRACWYASPKQNRRRVSQWLAARAVSHPAAAEHTWAEPINNRLLGDGLIAFPLSPNQILNLVDPQARGAETVAGFDPAGLLDRCFPGYQVLRLDFTDYLGESARKLPLARVAADKLLSVVAAGRGALFSWIIRKPSITAATSGASYDGPRETAG